MLDTASRGITVLELKVELLRFIVTARLEQKDEAKAKAERKAKKERLLQILAEKQDETLTGLSEAKLQKMIEELED